jgi:hypothetical protein
MILSALGLVTPEFLKSKRRHAMVAITVAASFLTPGDVITLTIMLMVPLFFLYEFSIYLSRLIWRRKRARENEEESRESPAHSDRETEGPGGGDGPPGEPGPGPSGDPDPGPPGPDLPDGPPPPPSVDPRPGGPGAEAENQEKG